MMIMTISMTMMTMTMMMTDQVLCFTYEQRDGIMALTWINDHRTSYSTHCARCSED